MIKKGERKMKCPKCGTEIKLSLIAEEMGKKGGAVKSKEKAKSSSQNGKLGGRPRKDQKNEKK